MSQASFMFCLVPSFVWHMKRHTIWGQGDSRRSSSTDHVEENVVYDASMAQKRIFLSDPRPKTQDPSPRRAEPSRTAAGRAWGTLSSSELFNLSCHEDIYILLKINSPNQCEMLTSFH
ncbi:unnamed protein product [Brassica oleracea var. botrytis]